MPKKICEVCGKHEDHSEEKHNIYGVCADCIQDRHMDFPE